MRNFLSTLRSGRNKRVLVVGPFRSGTNLLKYYLEAYCGVEVVFSKWFWKHGLPPTMGTVPVPKGVPIAVMTRDPVHLNVSLFKFWKKRRPELDSGESLSEFIRKPLIVYDNTGGNVRPKYYFSSPTEYWNQYYFSWINWQEIDARRMFVKLEDLHSEPNEVVSEFSDFAGLRKRQIVDPPEFYLSASSDGRQVSAASSDLERGDEGRLVLNEVDHAEIARQVNGYIAQTLGYSEYLKDGYGK